MPNVTSLGMVSSGTSRVKETRRSMLVMGDVYRVERRGRTFMHTGCRTAPPSACEVIAITPLGPKTVPLYKVHGRHANGENIIGWQSIIVDGAIKPGSDGAVVSFEDKRVFLVGKGTISLELAGDL